jgi:hypothetical protein
MDGADMSLDLSSKVNNPAPGCTQETEFMPLITRDLGEQFEQLNILNGMRIAASRVFTDLPDNKINLISRLAKDLYVGQNFLQKLVLLHRGRYSDGVNKDTMFLVIGNKPERAKDDKADEQKIPLITYESLLSLIEGKTTVSKLCSKPRPDITAFLEGWGPSISSPPDI